MVKSTYVQEAHQWLTLAILMSDQMEPLCQEEPNLKGLKAAEEVDHSRLP